MAFAADVTTMLADFGISVTKSGTTVKGILSANRVQLYEPGGAIVERVTDVVIRNGALTLARGDSITLADTSSVTEVTRVFGASSKAVTVVDTTVEDDGEILRVVVTP